jgi:polyhydroxybutyrate depolymerase
MRSLYLCLICCLCLGCEQDEVSDIILLDNLKWKSGKNVYEREIDGEMRRFIVHVPASYSDLEPVPVVYMLHGSGGTGNKFYNISGWVEKSEAEGFLAVFPTALEYQLTTGMRQTKWSSGGLVNDVPPGTTIKDDVPFFEELLNILKASFSVDASRLYISGFSNGGGFVKSQVVPRMGDTFAAAHASGGVGLPVVFPVSSDRRMPFFNSSGTLDDRIMESVGVREELPIQGEAIQQHDFLWSGLTNVCRMLNVDTVFQEMPNPPAFNLLVFDQPLANDASEFQFLMIKGLEHRYPNATNNPNGVRIVDLVWPWFSRHVR